MHVCVHACVAPYNQRHRRGSHPTRVQERPGLVWQCGHNGPMHSSLCITPPRASQQHPARRAPRHNIVVCTGMACVAGRACEGRGPACKIHQERAAGRRHPHVRLALLHGHRHVQPQHTASVTGQVCVGRHAQAAPLVSVGTGSLRCGACDGMTWMGPASCHDGPARCAHL